MEPPKSRSLFEPGTHGKAMQTTTGTEQWIPSDPPIRPRWSAAKALACGLPALILMAALWASPSQAETLAGQNIPPRASLIPPAAETVLKNDVEPVRWTQTGLGNFLATGSRHAWQPKSRGHEVPALDPMHRLLLISGFLAGLRFSRIPRLEKVLSLN